MITDVCLDQKKVNVREHTVKDGKNDFLIIVISNIMYIVVI